MSTCTSLADDGAFGGATTAPAFAPTTGGVAISPSTRGTATVPPPLLPTSAVTPAPVPGPTKTQGLAPGPSPAPNSGEVVARVDMLCAAAAAAVVFGLFSASVV